MNDQEKTHQELIEELNKLRHEIDSLIAAAKVRTTELINALQEISSLNEEKGKRAAELIIANLELEFETEEKAKRAAELVIANIELVFQNEEKEKRAAELIIANKELAFQNEEKAKRAAELVIANKELVFQNEEKAKRAAELIIANKELVFQNEEKGKRAKELEAANKDLEQFAYVASHDLNEPLRMISSFTQLLERKYKDKLDQDANDYIHFVVDGATRMQKLLTNLLDFSRVSTHAKPFEQVDTKTIVGQVISILQQLITENNALITSDDLPVIKADEMQIQRVFQNLIENAIKFKKKTELPKIHITCTKQNNMVQFSVADNGIGMEMQYHDRVFMVFQRLHSVKDYPGTGIGLSVCKRIVERHGGTIWFESTVNKGTIFYFTIPA
ncbi:MAG: ATP-binding protein [Paludibacter sp.]